MNEKRTNLEVIAPSVDEAIARGLADLGLPEEAVDIEILDTGTRGLFGLGTRQARVRLSIKMPTAPQPAEPPARRDVEQFTPADHEVGSFQPQAETSFRSQSEEMGDFLRDQVSEVAVGPSAAELEGKQPEDLEVARQVVEELVEKMSLSAVVSAMYGEPDEPGQRQPLIVNIQGKDLSILIGPHAETLNALQYIAGLIIGKQLGHSLPLVVDVESYRQRRAREVRLLARRMAEQAVRTGRRQYLEPMPANERRLVHIELRDHQDVITESIGEEPRRKVTVIPRQ